VRTAAAAPEHISVSAVGGGSGGGRVCIVTAVALEGSRDLGIWAGRKKKKREKSTRDRDGGEYETTRVV